MDKFVLRQVLGQLQEQILQIDCLESNVLICLEVKVIKFYQTNLAGWNNIAASVEISPTDPDQVITRIIV